MAVSSYDREVFLALPTERIAKLTRDKGKPRVGVFVPDGNRRLVLSTTEFPEGSDDFFTQVALTQTSYGLDNLKVFFSHGLPILFAPLFSRSVLARGTAYQRLTVLKTLNTLFAGKEWLDFYAAWDVRVTVYGDLSALEHTDCEQALPWIAHTQQSTRLHTKHMLFLGIGGDPWVGCDVIRAASRFQEEYHCEGSLDELMKALYGQSIPPADLLIFSSKLGGLGALPSLICNGDTPVYYLPAPGVQALTTETYRAILYDLLYMRDGVTGECCYQLSPSERERLRTWYADHTEGVIGLGHRIGSVWVPDGFSRSTSV